MSKIMLMMVGCLYLSGCVEDIKVIEVSGTNKEKIINESELFDLEVSGIRNTVTILEYNKVRNIDLNGLKNTVTINEETTVESFYLGGTDQTVIIPENAEINLSGRTDLHEIIEY